MHTFVPREASVAYGIHAWNVSLESMPCREIYELKLPPLVHKHRCDDVIDHTDDSLPRFR